MKTINLKRTWIALMIVPLLLSSCNKDILPGISGYGDVVTQTLMLDDFTGFGNGIAADIYISQGDEQEVVIKAQQNIIDNIEQDQVDQGFWSIKFDKWVRKSKAIKIYITIPNLDKISISGLGDVLGETSFANLDDLELKISGLGSMDLEFDCENLDVLTSGAGTFTLSGESKKMDVSISGMGNVRAFDLETEDADVRISGAGDADISVANFLKATISGSGNVIYRGTPSTDVHVSGVGKVKKDQ